MFDTPSATVQLDVGLLITAVITTTVPMILSIKEEQRFSNRHDRRALKKEEKEMKEADAGKNSKDAEKFKPLVLRMVLILSQFFNKLMRLD